MSVVFPYEGKTDKSGYVALAFIIDIIILPWAITWYVWPV